MADVTLAPDIAHQAVPAVKHVIKHVPHHITHVKQGFSMLPALISSVISLVVGAGVGYWYKSRGVSGMKADLANVKTDVQTIKAQITPSAIGGTSPTTPPSA